MIVTNSCAKKNNKNANKPYISYGCCRSKSDLGFEGNVFQIEWGPLLLLLFPLTLSQGIGPVPDYRGFDHPGEKLFFFPFERPRSEASHSTRTQASRPQHVWWANDARMKFARRSLGATGVPCTNCGMQRAPRLLVGSQTHISSSEKN